MVIALTLGSESGKASRPLERLKQRLGPLLGSLGGCPDLVERSIGGMRKTGVLEE